MGEGEIVAVVVGDGEAVIVGVDVSVGQVSGVGFLPQAASKMMAANPIKVLAIRLPGLDACLGGSIVLIPGRTLSMRHFQQGHFQQQPRIDIHFNSLDSRFHPVDGKPCLFDPPSLGQGKDLFPAIHVDQGG